MPIDPGVEAGLRSGLRSNGVSEELADALIASVVDLVDNFLGGRLRPSELSAGDFVEATARILQELTTGAYTQIGKPLPRMDRLTEAFANAAADESLRLHIPRVLMTIYGIRSRRGVGHLPGAISANRADAELLLTSAKWVLCELIRLFHTTSHEEAQREIDRLTVRHVPAVEEFEGVLRVVTRKRLSTPDTMLILVSANGGEATQADVVEWSRAPRKQAQTALARLDERNLIHRYRDGRIQLTTLGSERADQLRRQL